ncbi:hypothetical protein ANO11243_056160 [Dothideomycetidae sp. 11243]|nr:hypothetical protein ANO11243_056160 [fungal sp. No.11243]
MITPSMTEKIRGVRVPSLMAFSSVRVQSRPIPALLALFMLMVLLYRYWHVSGPAPELPLIADLEQYFSDYPIQPPYKDTLGEVGRRLRVVGDWILAAEKTRDSTVKAALNLAIENTIAAHFPFLRDPLEDTFDYESEQSFSPAPLAALRKSFKHGSAGIVIPCGEKTARFAGHLIVALRAVLRSKLPIQLVYAGDEDLSPSTRAKLSLMVASGPALEFLDITSVFDDNSLDLRSGGWAIKAFAVLGSHYERVILLDADSVFLQPPEVLLKHGAMLRTGALLFHDRLLWKGAFKERHAWWRDQIRRPSPAMNASLVWTEDYAEEGDSGVVVVDKSRLDVLLGMIHVCWQNSKEVRDEVTYKITYGDKESWWLGFELAGSKYEFEEHYAAIIGWEGEDPEGRTKVCSFVIAHPDEKNKLLWYNGSLLKNKQLKHMLDVYEVPEKWMVDGEWQKGAKKEDMSCMVGEEMRNVTLQETRILTKMIDRAQEVDAILAEEDEV